MGFNADLAQLAKDAATVPTSEPAAVDLTASTTSVISDTDNTDDLGTAAKAWKDLYLAGGIYIGGTTSANYLTDYEEGIWTGIFKLGGSGGTDNTAASSCTYTKVGRLVTAFVSLSLNSSKSGSGECYISGLPFTVVGGNGRGFMAGCNDKMDMTGTIIVLPGGTGLQFLTLPTSTGSNLAGFSDAKIGSGSGKGIYTNVSYYV